MGIWLFVVLPCLLVSVSWALLPLRTWWMRITVLIGLPVAILAVVAYFGIDPLELWAITFGPAVVILAVRLLVLGRGIRRV